VLLAATSGGMVLTLLAWGLVTDRVGERAVVALGLGGAGAAFLACAALPRYAIVFALLTLAGMVGASVSAASGRAVMGWFEADVIAAVTGATGLDGEAVRNVRLLERFVLFEVPAEQAERVADEVDGTPVRGHTLRLELAKG